MAPVLNVMRFTRGLKPLMDTSLHACRREVNQNPFTVHGVVSSSPYSIQYSKTSVDVQLNTWVQLLVYANL